MNTNNNINIEINPLDSYLNNTYLNNLWDTKEQVEFTLDINSKVAEYVKNKTKEIEDSFVEYANNLDLKSYILFREEISLEAKNYTWKQKFACYNLAACVMNNRELSIAA